MRLVKRFSTLFPYCILFLFILALNIMARKLPGFGEWYATTIYPLFVNSIARILSPLPFSVVEFALYALLLIGLFFFARGLWHVFQKKRRLLSFFGSCAKKVLLLAELLLLVYTLTCGINYHRIPFSVKEGFDVQKSSVQELIGLCESLTQDLQTLTPLVPRDTNGCALVPEHAPQIAAQAMTNLGSLYPSLAGYYPNPKILVVSEILSYQHLTGVYSPFTIEANVNGDMTAYNLPLTLCHELSHLTGFMREDEANFIGYLACRNSEDISFRYGGTLLAYIYATNALAKEDREAWKQIRMQLPEEANIDLIANNAFWDRYEGKIAEVSDKVNDTYLKLNNQTDGIKSYGRVVDLLLAEYRALKASTDRCNDESR